MELILCVALFFAFMMNTEAAAAPYNNDTLDSLADVWISSNFVLWPPVIMESHADALHYYNNAPEPLFDEGIGNIYRPMPLETFC